MERNNDLIAKHVNYNFHDICSASSEDAYSHARHHLKHLGIPQDPISNGLYKRGYELIADAFSHKDSEPAEYMLLYTNRLHEFFEEYYDNQFIIFTTEVVERTRLVIVWLYFIRSEELREKLYQYFKEWQQMILDRVK